MELRPCSVPATSQVRMLGPRQPPPGPSIGMRMAVRVSAQTGGDKDEGPPSNNAS